jgi:hypothetical protein
MVEIQGQIKSHIKKVISGIVTQPAALSVISQNPELKSEFSHFVVDLWRPEPTGAEDSKKKEKILELFPILMNEEIEKYRKEPSNLISEPLTPYALPNRLVEHISLLDKKIISKKEEMGKNWSEKANPFLTIIVEENFHQGEIFQKAAKLGSSLETSWGTWIQGIFPIFNPHMKFVGAAGIDFILNHVAYDIKSGPNILNLGDIEPNQNKRRIIQAIAKNPKFTGLIDVNDFQIATAYGTRDLSPGFMRDTGDLIIYGPDTWRVLTGNENNAFLVFIEIIRYKINNGATWQIADLENAVMSFNNLFYNGNKNKFDVLKETNDYVKIKKLIEEKESINI